MARVMTLDGLRRLKIQAPTPERIPGGRSSGQAPIFVDPAQIEQGIRVEMEHTTDPRVAYEIAVDHLYETPDYYTRLARMEQGLHQPELSRHLGEIRARLDQADRSWWQQPVELGGLLEPAKAHPLWILAGFVAGVLIASSGIRVAMRNGTPRIYRKRG